MDVTNLQLYLSIGIPMLFMLLQQIAVDTDSHIRDGRHALGEEIVQEFAAVQRNLWGTKL